MPDINEELLAALEAARWEIIALARNATDRIRDLGGDCDDAERTYGPTIARIDPVIASAKAISSRSSV